jgi:GTP-binding protein
LKLDKIAHTRRMRVPTPELNKFVEAVTAANPPVSPGRTHVRILYAAQIGVAPPSFVFFTNVATTLHFSYERFLVNKLREKFGFVGTPIRIQVRRRAKGGGPRKARPARTPGGAGKAGGVKSAGQAGRIRRARKAANARRSRKA